MSVENFVRLGKHDSTQGVPRPLKVVLPSKQDKVLEHSKNLYGNTEYKKVFITARLDSQTEAEKAGTGAAAKAEETKWGYKLDNCPGQDCCPKTTTVVETVPGGIAETWTAEKSKCLYTNANSVIGKMDELRHRIHTDNYAIIAVTETWARMI